MTAHTNPDGSIVEVPNAVVGEGAWIGARDQDRTIVLHYQCQTQQIGGFFV